MEAYTSLRKKILELAEVFLYAEAKDFTEALRGHRRRWKAIEYNLPYLVEEGSLEAVRYGHKLVYRLPQRRKYRAHDIEHGLICTKVLLAFLHCRQGELISERFFRQVQLGAVPEWAMLMDTGLLAFEYRTADNFRRTRLMKAKVQQYRESLYAMEDYFQTRVGVLFVFDAPEHKVKHFVESYGQPGDVQFFYTELDTFFEIQRSQHFDASIYIWARDGRRYPLTDD